MDFTGHCYTVYLWFTVSFFPLIGSDSLYLCFYISLFPTNLVSCRKLYFKLILPQYKILKFICGQYLLSVKQGTCELLVTWNWTVNMVEIWGRWFYWLQKLTCYLQIWGWISISINYKINIRNLSYWSELLICPLRSFLPVGYFSLMVSYGLLLVSSIAGSIHVSFTCI